MNLRLVAGSFALFLLLPAFTSVEALFAPDAELWERWQAHDPENREVVDYMAWGAFLTRYLRTGDDGVNRVDYGAVSEADHGALKATIAELSALPISQYSRAEQLAYWVNLYNALTLDVVLDHYPVDTIRDIDISPGLFSDGPWDKALVEVEGEALTLNDIEHRILRPIWQDPRIHYVVNCASIGCPDLAAVPYEGSGMEAALDAAARDYINDPRGVSFNGDKLVVSKIYDWFHEDFGGTAETVLAHIDGYAGPELKARLAGRDDIDDTAYDWALNGLPR